MLTLVVLWKPWFEHSGRNKGKIKGEFCWIVEKKFNFVSSKRIAAFQFFVTFMLPNHCLFSKSMSEVSDLLIVILILF